MRRKIQYSAKKLPFVFLPKAHLETVGLGKGSEVDVRVIDGIIQVIPVNSGA